MTEEEVKSRLDQLQFDVAQQAVRLDEQAARIKELEQAHETEQAKKDFWQVADAYKRSLVYTDAFSEARRLRTMDALAICEDELPDPERIDFGLETGSSYADAVEHVRKRDKELQNVLLEQSGTA